MTQKNVGAGTRVVNPTASGQADRFVSRYGSKYASLDDPEVKEMFDDLFRRLGFDEEPGRIDDLFRRLDEEPGRIPLAAITRSDGGGLKRENDELRKELAVVRRERDDAEAALSDTLGADWKTQPSVRRQDTLEPEDM